MIREPHRGREGQRGFSLVEVIIALALLGSVLIAMSGLYILGARHVDSGRSQSKALAVARDILEEMNGWSFTRTYWAFGGTVGSAPNVDPPIDSRFNTYALRWQDALDQDLAEAYALIELQSLPETSGLRLEEARAIRVVVTVHWIQAQRPRKVSLAMVRM